MSEQEALEHAAEALEDTLDDKGCIMLQENIDKDEEAIRVLRLMAGRYNE